MSTHKIKDLDGFKAMTYLLFSIEAKLRVHTELLIEMAEIITQKPQGTIQQEVALKTLDQLRQVREKFVEDDELLGIINNMQL